MNEILALRDKRAKAWDAAKAFLDERRKNSASLSAEDTAAYEKMETEIVNYGKEIDLLERRTLIDAEMSKPTSSPIIGKPGTDSENKTGRASNEYRSAFWNVMRNKITPDVVNVLSIGVDTEGGHLVPDEYERSLVEALDEENVFRQLAKIIRTSSGDRKIPVVAVKGEAAWIDENEPIPESDNTFKAISIASYKLATMIRVSNELLNDSVFDIEAYIAREFGRRTGAEEENAFVNGDGSGKPTGILHDTDGAEIGVAASSATAISLDEVLDLFHSLRAPYRKRATFVMNDSTVKSIRKLKDGNGQYLWQPSIKDGTPDTILNRPIKTSAYMPIIAAGAKPIVFGDFSYYWIADRQGRVFQRLNELYAAKGQVGFLTYERVDGKLILPEAMKVMRMKV